MNAWREGWIVFFRALGLVVLLRVMLIFARGDPTYGSFLFLPLLFFLAWERGIYRPDLYLVLSKYNWSEFWYAVWGVLALCTATIALAVAIEGNLQYAVLFAMIFLYMGVLAFGAYRNSEKVSGKRDA